jgi:hypothetical protein
VRVRSAGSGVRAEAVRQPRGKACATTKERPPFATGPKFREEPHDRLIRGCVVWRRSHTDGASVREPTGALVPRLCLHTCFSRTKKREPIGSDTPAQLDGQ